mmetsp:Transcript_19018/g.26348  ORF Transcript_19018/g.26348 Transcript_19018/m.26348 type:complete len:187 (+) Transcript_19018:62-622(+)
MVVKSKQIELDEQSSVDKPITKWTGAKTSSIGDRVVTQEHKNFVSNQSSSDGRDDISSWILDDAFMVHAKEGIESIESLVRDLTLEFDSWKDNLCSHDENPPTELVNELATSVEITYDAKSNKNMVIASYRDVLVSGDSSFCDEPVIESTDSVKILPEKEFNRMNKKRRKGSISSPFRRLNCRKRL